ncbi:hypothetical protein [Clostridium cellulovorans]|uniref:Bacteriocin biosynthesis cyclodehydratase, SagC family n=1 Tax=Clostridium cellulovorans (strain ATCC 35296 / DSM 3052 / OCM 3 / 743B) TaxID=573061 RepID=D9SWL6_CLOC7|nr:hypothetical protein [Clostridium cellulovorans]ADL53298.1 hypothetical protein Clocel_3627 [Clostridium cellulovorans 743B]
MFIKLKDHYSIIAEKNNFVIYNSVMSKFDFIIRIEDEKKRELLEKLQEPLDLDKFEKEDEIFLKAMIKKYLHKFLEEVPEKSIDAEIERNKQVQKFLVLHKDAFDLTDYALLALVKESLYRTAFIFIGFKENNSFFRGFNTAFVNSLEEITFEENEVYVINPLLFSREAIKSFEEKALEKKCIRLYVKENLRFLEIGPTLFAKDFGCYCCNEIGKLNNLEESIESVWVSGELSDMAFSLIESELLKISRKIIESLVEDITISKGKVFCLDKYKMEAEQREIEPNEKCLICQGERI